ncbi:MAG: TRAP transporter substrate-binding protein DctP [Dehalococcoidales bacterium]|nr:TRAP transporter substrate-binding protein DctP [Dehalococcoidales bacterium]
MKNKLFACVLSLILVMVLVVPSLLACSDQTTSAPPAATSASPAAASNEATTPAEAAEVIKLKMASPWPPTASATKDGDMLIEVIHEKSQGRLEIAMYAGEALGKTATTLDMLNNGVCDMAIIPTGSFPNVFALYNGLQLPMLGISSAEAMMEVAHALNDKGFIGNQDKYIIFAFNIPRQTNLWFKNKQVLKAEDFKGLKIRATDPTFLKPFEQFGLTPISMPSADVYSSIERGILDGATQTPENIISMKLYEVEKYGLDLPFAWAGAVMAISKKSYDKLPPDLQAVVSQSFTDFEKKAKVFYADVDAKISQELKDKGVQMYKLDASEQARWQTLYDANLEEWIGKREAEGLKAREMIEIMKSIVQKYK